MIHYGVHQPRLFPVASNTPILSIPALVGFVGIKSPPLLVSSPSNVARIRKEDIYGRTLCEWLQSCYFYSNKGQAWEGWGDFRPNQSTTCHADTTTRMEGATILAVVDKLLSGSELLEED